jgi:hypothetical protein
LRHKICFVEYEDDLYPSPVKVLIFFPASGIQIRVLSTNIADGTSDNKDYDRWSGRSMPASRPHIENMKYLWK